MAKLQIIVKRREEEENGTWTLTIRPVALTTDAGAVIGTLSGPPFRISELTQAQATANPPGTTYNCPIQA